MTFPASSTPADDRTGTAPQADAWPGDPPSANPPLWTFHRAHSPLISTSIHAGHGLRPEVASGLVLPEAGRRREEDPFTDQFLPTCGSRVVVHCSRFEVDLNRPRERAVYQQPDDAWGLEMWPAAGPPADLVKRSLAQYDAFYRDLAHHLTEWAEAWGKVVVFDIHSYNHRRDGADAAPADPEGNPEINLGTGNLDRDRWAPVVDTFLEEMGKQEVGGRRLDVRENVRFEGGHFSDWVGGHLPGHACALAIEVKKIFMDEWTGERDAGAVAEVRAALTATVPAVLGALKRVGRD